MKRTLYVTGQWSLCLPVQFSIACHSVYSVNRGSSQQAFKMQRSAIVKMWVDHCQQPSSYTG